MGTYTLFGQAPTGTSLASDPTAYTMGVEFSVSSSVATLTGIWFYSASGATVLPGFIGLYLVSGTSLVHSETPSWSGAAGSGWVRSAFSSPPSLSASTNYKAVVGQSTLINWYSATSAYWSSGPGASGLTVGVLSAPADSGASPGQDSYDTSVPGYPSSSFNAANYWVDPEISTPEDSGNVSLALAPMAMQGTAAGTGGTVTSTGSVALAPMRTAGSVSEPLPVPAPDNAIPGLARPGRMNPADPLQAATFESTGSLALAPMALHGTSAAVITAAGSLALAPMHESGTATEVQSVSGSLALAPMQESGTATTVAAGSSSASIALSGMALQGSASVVFPEAGELALAPMELAGTASVQNSLEATGSLALAPMSIRAGPRAPLVNAAFSTIAAFEYSGTLTAGAED